MVKSILFQLLLLLGSVQFLFGQSDGPSFWADVAERPVSSAAAERLIRPKKYRTISVDVAVLQSVLAETDQGSATTQITIPTPDGKTARFEIWETPVMAPALQARFPEIKCFTGRGLDDPTMGIKCDLTPWGFHVMTWTQDGNAIFIDPYFHGDPSTGIVYYKKDYQRPKNDAMSCLTVSETPGSWNELTPGAPAAPKDTPEAGDCVLRKYRLALSCTGEYAAFHGGTKPLVLAAYNTTMNRINGVYEKDLNVTMQLIANTDTLIFLNAATDPFTNDDGGTMLGENQTVTTQRIGAANYDIGHVFSTGGGGIAGLGVVCNNSAKANGVTGGGSPIGDPFDIDYVAHEMGHQFGGNHSFNNSCSNNINQSTAMEPGSGSTIMAYAGICDPNVQSNSDDHFHAVNIAEMSSYINNGTGNGCPVKIVTGNAAPVVGNVPNYIIPKSTPFALTASASDVDGDPLTYCWEQMDSESATMPPVSTSTGGPLFRSYSPVSSPTRTFPRLPDLVTNTNSTWEELPGVDRIMNFRVVVRDNHPGGGCTAEDDVRLSVAGSAGPFTVTAPNTNVTWYALESRTVSWNVNNTNLAPVNCSTVKILLSYDGGFTYPAVLAESVPNNGSTVITVPFDMTSTTCRIKVQANGNVFFDISNTNFSILGSLTPTFTLSTASDSLVVCAGETASYTLKAVSLTGFAAPVNLSVSGAPAGAQVSVTPGQITPTGEITLTLGGLTPSMAGNYTVVVTGVSGGITRELPVYLTVLPGAPTASVTGVVPANGAVGISIFPTLTWDVIQYADNYTVEIAPDPSFSTQVIALNTVTNSVQVPQLTFGKPYYWRIKAGNQCGIGAFNNFNAFQTGGEQCNQTFTSTNVPVNIDLNGGPVNVSSILNVPANQSVVDVDISLNIAHTWVGDLDAALGSPDGTIISLFDRPGVPANSDGCFSDNIIATFNDEAATTAAVFESTCNNPAPAINGAFQPVELLDAFNGKNAQGVWTLYLNDNFPEEDAGAITAWSLSFCFVSGLTPAQVLTNTPLTVPFSTTGSISSSLLAAAVSGNAGQVVFTVTAIPQSGTLKLNGAALAVGSTFTQADINGGLLVYTHGGNNATTDQFRFDVFDQNNNAWLANQAFQIVILPNNLSATAAITTNISCNGGNNGVITVTATGGNAPLLYSLNAGAGQVSNVFGNLNAGTYSIMVTDAFGLTQSAGSFTLTNPTAITVGTAVSFDDLTVTAGGGTGAFQYSINGINFQASGVFENLSDGIYTVTVKDANGCTATAQVAVSVSALLATVAQTGTIDCFGEQTGAIAVTVVGGFLPYEYSLNGIDYQLSNTFGGLAAGTYTVVVRDANGSTTTSGAVTIAQPSVITATTSVSLNVITVSVTGGSGPYTFTLNGASQGTNVFTVTASGNYTIIVTDANGCTKTASATVTIPTLAITNLQSENILLCDGIIGTLTVIAGGGVPPYEYRLDGGIWQTSMSFQNIQPGSHTFEVMDAVGAVDGDNLTVVQPTPVVASLVSVIGTDAVVTATGGSSPYTYSLNNGTPQSSGTFEGLPNGSYTVVAADANGCSSSVSFEINYAPVAFTVSITPVSCFGLWDGIVSYSVTGGVAPYTFLQSPSGPWQNIPAGTYNVTVTDATGSSSTASFVVTQPAALVANITQANGTVTVDATGGTQPYGYSIDSGVTFQSGNTFTDLTNGIYTVVVLDANGCLVASDITVLGSVEPTAAWGVRVSPNPGTGFFQLYVGAAPVGTMEMAIYDVAGRVISTRLLECHTRQLQTTLDLTMLPSGTYFLRLTHGNSTGAIRLVVNK